MKNFTFLRLVKTVTLSGLIILISTLTLLSQSLPQTGRVIDQKQMKPLTTIKFKS